MQHPLFLWIKFSCKCSFAKMAWNLIIVILWPFYLPYVASENRCRHHPWPPPMPTYPTTRCEPFLLTALPLSQESHRDSMSLKKLMCSVSNLHRHLCNITTHTYPPSFCVPETTDIQSLSLRTCFSLFNVSGIPSSSCLSFHFFFWICCWSHRLEDLWARQSMKTCFLRVTKYWFAKMKNHNVLPIIKGQKMSKFHISFWKVMTSGITRLRF